MRKLRLAFLPMVLACTHWLPVFAQDVGPSGCVMYCDSGGGSYSGGSVDPMVQAGIQAGGGILGAVVTGVIAELQRQADPRYQATLINNRAVEIDNDGDYGEAIELYEAALELDPNDPTIRSNLASAYNNYGVYSCNRDDDYSCELDYYNKALQLDPTNELYQQNIRVVLRMMEAEATYNRQIQIVDQTFNDNVRSLAEDLDSDEAPASALEMMDFESTNLNNPDIAAAGQTVGGRLREIENEILNAPAGESAWDGGFGGTLDGPEAGNLPLSDNGSPQYTRSGLPAYAQPDSPGTSTEQPGSFDSSSDIIQAASQQAANGNYKEAISLLESVPTDSEGEVLKADAIAYVRGMEASDSAQTRARISRAPSPKAEIVLDALQAGNGSWETSIGYLEGMRARTPNDEWVLEALNYTRGMYAYEVGSNAGTIKNEIDLGRARSPAPETQPNTRISSAQELGNSIASMFANGHEDSTTSTGLGNTEEPSVQTTQSPTAATPVRQDTTIPDEGLFQDERIGPAVDRTDATRQDSGLYGLPSPSPDDWVSEAIDQFVEEEMRRHASDGLMAIHEGNYGSAKWIFTNLHDIFPNDVGIRDVKNYVDGLYDAAYRDQGG